MVVMLVTSYRCRLARLGCAFHLSWSNELYWRLVGIVSIVRSSILVILSKAQRIQASRLSLPAFNLLFATTQVCSVSHSLSINEKGRSLLSLMVSTTPSRGFGDLKRLLIYVLSLTCIFSIVVVLQLFKVTPVSNKGSLDGLCAQMKCSCFLLNVVFSSREDGIMVLHWVLAKA